MSESGTKGLQRKGWQGRVPKAWGQKVSITALAVAHKDRTQRLTYFALGPWQLTADLCCHHQCWWQCAAVKYRGTSASGLFPAASLWFYLPLPAAQCYGGHSSVCFLLSELHRWAVQTGLPWWAGLGAAWGLRSDPTPQTAALSDQHRTPRGLRAHQVRILRLASMQEQNGQT